jgi:hypothetical protein
MQPKVAASFPFQPARLRSDRVETQSKGDFMSIGVEPLAYRPKDFARLTGLSLSTVKREIYAGNLKVVRRRGVVLIPAEAARAYLAINEETRIQTESVTTQD